MTTLVGGISFGDDQRNINPLGEQAPTLDDAVNRVANNLMSRIRVAIPAKVVAYYPATQTIDAQPTVRERRLNRQTGQVVWEDFPLLQSVPVIFPSAGDFAITMPITVDDEVQLLINDLCIDSWYTRGDVQNWNDKRRHDLSDAVAILGLRSTPNLLASVSTTALEIRSASTKISVSVDTVTVGVGSSTAVVSPAGITLTSPVINLAGTLNINGSPYLAHTHSGVTSGAGVTGGVV